MQDPRGWNNDQRERTAFDQSGDKGARIALLRERSALGSFKGKKNKDRSPEDQAARNRIDAAIKAVEQRLEARRVLLRKPGQDSNGRGRRR